MTDTLKSICEQCAHLRNPRLDFLPAESQHQKEIILRDLKELISAASLEKEKSVVLLAGAIFESVLYCFIQSQTEYISDRRGEVFTFRPDFGLRHFVKIFNKYFGRMLALPDILPDYRDLVHINRELQYPAEICGQAAREMLRLLDSLLGKLSE